MWSSGQVFFSKTSLKKSYTEDEILSGKVVKINPALITITDGMVNKVETENLQKKVLENVIRLLKHGKVRTFHVDINFEDYSGFDTQRPDLNYDVFNSAFLERLNQVVQSHKAFLNVHLLTDYPLEHLRDFRSTEFGAICFELDTTRNVKKLERLVGEILEMGACPSPVIETVDSANRKPISPQEVKSLLEPVLSSIGMLTFQAARTASRSNQPGGSFNSESVRKYMESLRQEFDGTFQIQGGITRDTVGEALRIGAEFLVTGTAIFRNLRGLACEQAMDEMLQKAAESLLLK